jgi:hypothetical protein
LKPDCDLATKIPDRKKAQELPLEHLGMQFVWLPISFSQSQHQ